MFQVTTIVSNRTFSRYVDINFIVIQLHYRNTFDVELRIDIDVVFRIRIFRKKDVNF